MIVQANVSTLLCDCIYVPDICINLKDYKGSTSNMLVAWETGESTYEPLDFIASDDPIKCAEYSLKHNLLDEPGWKHFRPYTRKKNKLGCIVNQTKASSYRQLPFWKFGVLVPRTHKQAMELDMTNNSNKWQDAEKTEMHQLLEYHCKGVVIDFPACEQCSSLFGGESAFDYTPEIKICFEKSRFHLLNGDPNVKQHIVKHILIDWTGRTMKNNLVHFKTQFNHCLFLENKDRVPEDWKRSKFKELVT
jgi:hypothetical protein